MNTTILIIGLIAIAAFVIPMAIINNHGKAAKEKKQKAIDDFAQSNGLQVTESHIFKTMWLAIDKVNGKLIYSKDNENKIIDLFSATSVKIDKTYEPNNQKIIESITLNIASKKESVAIPFYHSSLKNTLDLHEQNVAANEWLQKIDLVSLGKQKEGSKI